MLLRIKRRNVKKITPAEFVTFRYIITEGDAANHNDIITTAKTLDEAREKAEEADAALDYEYSSKIFMLSPIVRAEGNNDSAN
jgi:hypothetical protein